MSRLKFLQVYIFLTGLIWCYATAGIALATPTVHLEKAVHFVTPSGDDVVVGPGVFVVEVAEEWLRFIPKDGGRADAILVQAEIAQHGESITAPMAKSQTVAEDQHLVALLLPDGTTLEVEGSYSGVRSRGRFGFNKNRFSFNKSRFSRQKKRSKSMAQSQKWRTPVKPPIQQIPSPRQRFSGGAISGSLAVGAPSISFPKGGGELYFRQTYAITWAGFSGNTVKIYFNRSGASTAIAASTQNDGSYSWTVPTMITSQEYHVNVSGVENINQFASTKRFSIREKPQTAVVTSPASGDVCYVGESCSITWSGIEGTSVILSLYRGNGVQSSNMSGSSLSNTGSFTWQIPNMMSAANYRIRIQDASDPHRYSNSGDFSIATRPSMVEVTRPRAGDVYHPGDTVVIQWAGVPGDTVKIDKYRGNGGGSLFYRSPNDGEEYWTIPPSFVKRASDDYRIIVREVNGVQQANSSGIFEIRNPDQNTAIMSPQAGNTFQVHDTINVSWSGFGSASVTIELYRGNIPVQIITTTGNDGSHSWLIPSSPSIPGASNYRVMVYNLENLEFSETGDFMISP